MGLRAATFCLLAVALASCEQRRKPTVYGPPTPPPPPLPCKPTGWAPTKALAHIGPDVTVSAICGTDVEVPVASISNVGGGIIHWNATLEEGDASILSFPAPQGDVCGGSDPLIVLVRVKPPQTALPGAAVDGTISIRAAGDEFAPTRVKIHADVVAAVLDSDRDVIDFGELFPDQGRGVDIDLINNSVAPLLIQPPDPPPPSLAFQGSTLGHISPGRAYRWKVALNQPPIGDYDVDTVWRGIGLGNDQPEGPCVARKTIKVRAHVIARPDGAVPGWDANGDGRPDAATAE